MDPRIIGDKPKWYSHYVQPLFFQVHNPHSRLGCDLYEDSDDSDSDKEVPSTIEEEDSNVEEDGHQSIEEVKECSDNCSCCSSSDTDSSTGEEDEEDLFNNANDSETMFDGSCYNASPSHAGMADSVTRMPAFRFVCMFLLSSFYLAICCLGENLCLLLQFCILITIFQIFEIKVGSKFLLYSCYKGQNQILERTKSLKMRICSLYHLKKEMD